MEPMTLGSPVGSPTTPSSPTSPFLPAYLMGENAPSASTPRASMQARQQTPKHVSFASGGLTMPSMPTNAPAAKGGRTIQSVTSPTEKSTSDFGPPVLGLFDTLSPLPGAGMSSHHNSTFPSTSGLYSSTVFSPSSVFQSPLASLPSTSQGNPLSPGPSVSIFESENQILQDSPSNKESRGGEGGLTSQKESEQNTWVTVFGFMPNTVNDIIAHFVHCGTILEYKWANQTEEGKSSGQRCNWIHLRFRTIREARRAIAKNGKVFGGTMMVGVVPCQDPEILRSQKENIQGPEISFPAKPKTPSGAISGIRPLGIDFISPIKESNKTKASSSNTTESTGIRPLIKTLPQNDMETASSVKNNGLISRTIDFLFGQ